MAGTTTAARAGWGIIASSEAMNPRTQGEYLNNNSNASGSFTISNIPTTEWRDLEICFLKGNQSTWTAQWNFWFNNNSGLTNSSYWYRGHSNGAGYSYNSQSSSYMYPSNYSAYGHFCRIYVANYSSNQENKAFWSQASYTNGVATSYGTIQFNSGVINTSSPITSFHTQDPWSNGSSSYQWWQIVGRGVKE